ncbi:MAG: glycosyltransferase [Flavobacteriales bacterium]|nr:glycosyltransferase [Flavobacteriales bacterium]
MSGSEHIPRVTVLLPVYNAAPFLRATLDSILHQRFSDFEILAMDDGSTDGSLAILSSYTDPRLRVVAHERNKGLIATLNEGIEAARGTYIARMDADDLMHPDRLAQQVAHLDAHPELVVLATCVETINSDGEVTGKWDVDQATLDEQAIRAMMPRTNCIAHPSVMIRRSALADLRYSPAQKGAEDWDLWLRMLSRGLRIAKLPDMLLQYRVHSGSIMGGAKKDRPYELRLLNTRWRFLWREWSNGRFSRLQSAVINAQARTLARYVKNELLLPFLRDLKRLLTYSHGRIVNEAWALTKVENEWRGHLMFVFPYLNTGGAEQVHADILATVADQRPLVVITGRSTDHAFRENFAKHACLLELHHLLNHPLWRKRTLKRLAALLNQRPAAQLFASNASQFFELLPLINEHVRTTYLVHAFLYQPNGNQQHKYWLRYFARVNAYVFISSHSREQYERLLFANNIPRSQYGKLLLLTNAVHRFGEVRLHQRPGVLFVGRHSPEKRLLLFLALTDHLERTAPGRFRFTVVGADHVQGHAHVDFRGKINDPDAIAAIYSDHDMLVLTSEREGFPMVIMEAMAHGLLVVSTPVGDVPARLSNDLALITTSAQEEVVLTEMEHGILSIVADRDRFIRMRQASLTEAQKEFGIDRFRAAYRALLTDSAS